MVLRDYFDKLNMLEGNSNELVLTEPYLLSNTHSNKYYKLSKHSAGILYELLEVDKKMSEKLFELDKDAWSHVINSAISNAEENPLKTMNFISYKSIIVDITTVDFSEFRLKLSDFISQISLLEEDTIINSSNKIVSNLIPKNTIFKSSPIFVMTIDYDRSLYCIHQGKSTVDSKILLFNSPFALSNNLVDFVSSLDNISEDIAVSEDISYFLDDSNNDVNLSIRELLDFIKRSKCNIMIDDNGMAYDIDNSESSVNHIKSKIIDEFSVMPYKSLKKLKFLKKSLRDTSISISELLEYFSVNLTNQSFNIDGFFLADLYNLAANSDFDYFDKLSEIPDLRE